MQECPAGRVAGSSVRRPTRRFDLAHRPRAGSSIADPEGLLADVTRCATAAPTGWRAIARRPRARRQSSCQAAAGASSHAPTSSAEAGPVNDEPAPRSGAGTRQRRKLSPDPTRARHPPGDSSPPRRCAGSSAVVSGRAPSLRFCSLGVGAEISGAFVVPNPLGRSAPSCESAFSTGIDHAFRRHLVSRTSGVE